MDKRKSRDKRLRDGTLRDKRLRRRRVILGIWRLIQGLWSLVKSLFGWITFKKGIIVSVLIFIAGFVIYLARDYKYWGMPFPTDVANTIITVAVGQLALTAISSLGSRAVEYVQAKFGNDCEIEEDINYG